jgi:hypothetical protein
LIGKGHIVEDYGTRKKVFKHNHMDKDFPM